MTSELPPPFLNALITDATTHITMITRLPATRQYEGSRSRKVTGLHSFRYTVPGRVKATKQTTVLPMNDQMTVTRSVVVASRAANATRNTLSPMRDAVRPSRSHPPPLASGRAGIATTSTRGLEGSSSGAVSSTPPESRARAAGAVASRTSRATVCRQGRTRSG